LAKIALKKELNLADGIHPNEKGHELLAEYFFQFFTKAGYL
jgi:lysophospholipase L1-like esterase